MIKEAESSLKIPVTFCSVHQERAVLSVCLDESCPSRGMFCYQCIKFHYAHLDRTFEIKEFLNSVSDHINELSFDMLPTEASPSIKEVYRSRYEQVVQNKESLLKEKELIIEAIGKFVQLTMESAEKKLEDIDTKNPASQKTQTMQELTSYQEKFFDLANLQPEELYDMLVFFSRFITKTSDDKIEIIKGAPGKNPLASFLPKQVALAVEGDLDSTCQTLKNSQLILQKLAGILERLPPDDKAHPKLNNLKAQPQQHPQQQQQLAQQQYAKKRQIQPQPSPYHNQERTFTHKSVNLNGHYHQQQQQQQQQQQRSQIHGFENNNNLFEQMNPSNGNSVIVSGGNNHPNHPRRPFNQASVLAGLPQFEKSSVSYKNNSRDTSTAPTQAAPAPSFLQQFQQKINENNMNKQAQNNAINAMSTNSQNNNPLRTSNANNKPIEGGGELLGSFNSSEETTKGQKRQEDNQEKLAFQKDLEKRRNAQKIEVTSSQRLSLRSIEHFCDALEVNYNDAWCVSFKVNEECNLSGIYHFPIFVYESSVGDSLPTCELELSIFEGNNGSFKNAIFQQTVFLTKNNGNLSSSTTSCLDELSDSKETLLKVLEKITLNASLALSPNQAYTIVFRNRTREQQDMSKQLYILFGDDSSQGKQDKTNGNKFVSFQQTETQSFQSAFSNSKLIVSNNDSLEDPQLTDYFVPFLALTHQSNMTPLKNINGEMNKQSQLISRQSTVSSAKKQKTPNNILEQQPLFQASQIQPQGFKDLINNYKPIGNSSLTSTYAGINNNNNNENDFTKYNSRIANSGNQINNNSTTAPYLGGNNQANGNSSSNNNKRKYQNTYPAPQVQNFTVPPQYGHNNSNSNTSSNNSQIYPNNGASNNYYHQNQGLNSNFDKNGVGQEFATQKKLKR